MFCPKCGTQLPDDSRFCSSCGTAIRDASQRPAQQQPAQAQQAAQQSPAQQPPIQAQQPAQPQPPVQQLSTEAAPQPAPKRRTKTIAAIAASAAAAVVVAVAIAIALTAPPTSGPAGSPAQDTVTGSAPIAAQTTGAAPTGVTPLERPRLISGTSSHMLTIKPSVSSYTIDADLGNVYRWNNRAYPEELNALLKKNGFAVMAGSGDYEFHEIYERNRYSYVPSFITVDSMMHAYHLYYQHLQEDTERAYLAPSLLSASQAMLAESQAQYEKLKGTEWENAALRNMAFFAVGCKLLDPSTQVPNAVAQDAEAELASIQNASGIAPSAIFGGQEDYTQYIPRSYYAGDEILEPYFRAMMWYGRMNLAQSDDDLDRSALLMTLALHDTALDDWSAIYTVTSFFTGASDDCGYYEYYPIAQAAYGNDVAVESLVGNTEGWNRYHAMTAQVQAPQINSVIVQDEGTNADHLEEEKGFRFMGQRFTIDASIMQQLVYNKVGESSTGERRMLPNALDVPAALGSDEALSILRSEGAADFAGYEDNIAQLRNSLGEDNANLWKASLASEWLYTLNPLLEEKGAGYPTFMQSKEWARKNLQTYLGSYTELKHDSILYAKQVVAEMGGGGTNEQDDRGYVEPEPAVYARLADLVQDTAEGLDGFGMLSAEDAENMALLQTMAERLQAIAEKELKEEALTDEEYDFIREYGGYLEHFWSEVYKDDAEKGALRTMNFPAAIVADIATNSDGGTCLELGTGRASTIYVIVPVEGELRLTRGSVYSFYQFEQPTSQRLTDAEWREMLDGWNYDNRDDPNRVHVEGWTSSFQAEQ